MVIPPVSPQTVTQSHKGLSPSLVFIASWLLSLPWAVVHGPVDPMWVVFQALGAAVIPALVGWAVLWRTRGNLQAGLVGSVVAAGVVLAWAVWG